MTGYQSRTSATVNGERLRANMQDRWFDRGACIGTDPKMWHGTTSTRTDWEPGARYDECRDLCRTCPVIAQCRLEAELTDDWCFRAGETQKERRRRMKRQRGAS